mgnify:CR=1 FL=1|tara:strand:- start:120 stop:1730 length:1611 start_codon:yes stop_codon:yes gene_type:complete
MSKRPQSTNINSNYLHAIPSVIKFVEKSKQGVTIHKQTETLEFKDQNEKECCIVKNKKSPSFSPFDSDTTQLGPYLVGIKDRYVAITNKHDKKESTIATIYPCCYKDIDQFFEGWKSSGFLINTKQTEEKKKKIGNYDASEEQKKVECDDANKEWYKQPDGSKLRLCEDSKIFWVKFSHTGTQQESEQPTKHDVFIQLKQTEIDTLKNPLMKRLEKQLKQAVWIECFNENMQQIGLIDKNLVRGDNIKQEEEVGKESLSMEQRWKSEHSFILKGYVSAYGCEALNYSCKEGAVRDFLYNIPMDQVWTEKPGEQEQNYDHGSYDPWWDKQEITIELNFVEDRDGKKIYLSPGGVLLLEEIGDATGQYKITRPLDMKVQAKGVINELGNVFKRQLETYEQQLNIGKNKEMNAQSLVATYLNGADFNMEYKDLPFVDYLGEYVITEYGINQMKEDDEEQQAHKKLVTGLVTKIILHTVRLGRQLNERFVIEKELVGLDRLQPLSQVLFYLPSDIKSNFSVDVNIPILKLGLLLAEGVLL